MGALDIAGFGFQKRCELLPRHSRQRPPQRVATPKTVGKHHKLTGELRCFSDTFVQYQIHHIDWLIDSSFSKDFQDEHFKKFEFFYFDPEPRPEVHGGDKCELLEPERFRSD